MTPIKTETVEVVRAGNRIHVTVYGLGYTHIFDEQEATDLSTALNLLFACDMRRAKAAKALEVQRPCDVGD